MAARGVRGRTGEKSNRFMIVGTKDTLPAGTKTRVVAPVPINTPSLRQEIQGAHGESTGASLTSRSSTGGGWGAVVGIPSATAGNDRGDTSGKSRDRAGGGGRSQSGDDVFTRHFPDLRAGLEQAERLDAVTKASSKVAPLRKPKPEPAKEQGPSLRPQAMLKPTGSAGGGSTATAAAQAAIKDAVHNRVAEKPKTDEPRRNGPSFADEISSTSRWTGRSPTQESGRGRQEAGNAGHGRAAGGRGAWETNRDGGRDKGGGGGRGYDRERGPRDGFQDKDRRNGGLGSDRNAGTSRARESIFGSGAHAGMGNADHENARGGSKVLTTTYVRQHGPPPRKSSTQGASAPIKAQAPTQLQEQPAARFSHQPDVDRWNSAEKLNWHTASFPDGEPVGAPESSPTLDSSSSQSGSYVRTHGPPRRGGREGLGDEQGSTPSSSRPDGSQATGRELDAVNEPATRFSSSWGASDHGRGGTDRDTVGNGERTPSGRWKEPAVPLAPPPAPTNTRWKEPKEEITAPRPGMRRWRSGSREESHVGSGRWSREILDTGDVDSSVGPSASSPPAQEESWKDSAGDGWGMQPGEDGNDANLSSITPKEQQEHKVDNIESLAPETETAVPVSSGEQVDIVGPSAEVSAPSTATADEDSPSEQSSFPNSFAQKQRPAAQTVLRTASWEPQLPRGGDTWSTAGHGRDTQGDSQGAVQSGQPGSGTPQPWSDPWGTSSFGLSSAGGEQGSSAIASLLGNNGPGKPRKDRYLPPALRNRTPNEGKQADSSTNPTGEQDTERNAAPLQSDGASSVVSNQEFAMSGAGTRLGAGNASGAVSETTPLYEQHAAPLEEWQQGGTQTSHRLQDDQAARPMDQQRHQRQPQHLHLHDQPQQLHQEYRPTPPTSFSPFQPQDQAGRSPVPERLQHHQYEHDRLHRQQYSQVQMHQQQPPQQMHMPQHVLQPHSLHQPPPPLQHMHPHHQGQQQLTPAPLGGEMGQAHHPRQHPGHLQQRQQQGQQHHHQQDIGREIGQPQQMHVQQQQQMQQHPPFMGYPDPRVRGTGALGGLAVHNMTQPGSFQDMLQHQSGMPPPGPYGFQSPDTRQKR